MSSRDYSYINILLFCFTDYKINLKYIYGLFLFMTHVERYSDFECSDK